MIAAPVGIVGLMQEFLRTAAPARLNMRSIVVIVLASYCFLVGILGIIFNLPAIQTANMSLAWMGVFGLVVGALNLTAAYGLLKLQSWAPRIATLAFAGAIVLAATHIWLDRASQGFGVHSVMVVLALVAIWLLQNRDVKVLYGGQSQSSARPVTA